MERPNETIVDITAEISDYRDPVVRERRLDVRLKAALKRERAKIEADVLAVGGILGASHKRETATTEKSSAVGDAAKLREALVAIREAMFRDSGSGPCAEFHTKVDAITQDALAAPPRNCDALSAHEQTEKFNQFCQSHRNSDLPKCAGCPLEDIPDGTGCAQAWGQMPYEAKEGGVE